MAESPQELARRLRESPLCNCGHRLAFHNPCSKCHCPEFTTEQSASYRPRTDRDPAWRPLDEVNPPTVNAGSGLLAPILTIGPAHLVGSRGADFTVVHLGRRLYLRTVCGPSEVEAPNRAMRRLRDRAAVMAIAMSTPIRLQPLLLTDELAILWEEPRYVTVAVDELLETRLVRGDASQFLDMLAIWIDREYPNVLALHSAGLFLLDRSYAYDAADVFFAEALLDFCRIAEAVAAARIGHRPQLADVWATADAIGSGFSRDEIQRLYVIRSADAAHGRPQTPAVTRSMAFDARRLAEEFVLGDFTSRSTGQGQPSS